MLCIEEINGILQININFQQFPGIAHIFRKLYLACSEIQQATTTFASSLVFTCYLYQAAKKSNLKVTALNCQLSFLNNNETMFW